MNNQRGIILLVSLIINMVISMLILGNMNNLIINTKLISSFASKQQLNIELKTNHKKFVKQFNANNTNCIYKLKQSEPYPDVEQNNKWCVWHNNLNKLLQFRVWDAGTNCCFKTSLQSFAHFFYLQLKIISKDNSSLLISTFVKSERNDNCYCTKVSGIKDGIINQLIS